MDEHDPADCRDICLSAVSVSIDRYERLAPKARNCGSKVREAHAHVLAALDFYQAELRRWKP